MAIATIERDPARDSGAPDLRFRLQAEICRTAGGDFWRAMDRRTGKSCVVRVIDDERDQASRRLGDLHRERTLAERIGHAGVLRAEVPLVESDRIFQLVEPEPARAITPEAEGGRLVLLQVLVAVAEVLSAAHARGLFHGAFSRSSCLRGVDGRVLVHGFMGDASAPAAVLHGAAADHRAFLLFADEMLRATGGPPPRLRRYFAQFLAEASPRPAAQAMTELCSDLRESLEDTFPWPLAVATPASALIPVAIPATARTAAVAPAPADVPLSVAVPVAPVRIAPTREPALRSEPVVAREAPRPAPAAAIAVPVTTARTPVADPASGAGFGRDASTPAARASAPAAMPSRVVELAAARPASDPVPPAARVEAVPVHEDDEPAVRGRSWRPWLAGLVALLVVGATLVGASKPRTTSVPGAAAAASKATVAPATASAPGTLEASIAEAPRMRPATPPSPAAPVTSRSPAGAGARTVGVAPMSSRAVATRPEASRSPAAPVKAAAGAPPDAVASPQAVRSRVATLVAGGNRALNALEPGAAAGAFAAALALSPADPAAREGSLRARRLEGVAALMRDARQATARGDHARALQGYAQALSNDPRNRGLVEALASARRKLGRDAAGTWLADGHAALGTGRFEDARAAFEKALAVDPQAPGARQAASQAAMAIQLRDQAEARRAATLAAAGRD